MSEVKNIITDNLPIWSSAVQYKSSVGRGSGSKRKLYGVKKLRDLILDLAVGGRGHSARGVKAEGQEGHHPAALWRVAEERAGYSSV